LIALGGQLKIASVRGERSVAVEDFFTDYFETVLEPDEMLIEIQVPNPPPYTGTAYTKFSHRVGDMAIAGAAVSITLAQTASVRTVRRYGACTDARIALSAVASVPMRAKRAESVLVGKEINDDLLKEAAQAAAEEADPISDIHASEASRRELVQVLVRQVAEEALRRVQTA
jgi:carbon-monoxide dehydrogenase medium subunit